MNASPHPTIALLQSSSLAHVVEQAIEQAILLGNCPPGSKLNEVVWAEKLGVSRGPIREAFRMLDEGGLVRTEKNRGVFVRDMPIDEAIEIFDLRAAMEEMVGRQLATRISPVQLKEIKALVDSMKKSVQEKNADDYHLLNLKFHDRLVEMTGNRKLIALYRKLIKELSLFRRLNLDGDAMLPLSVTGHKQIVKTIAAGDAEAAGRAMYGHVEESKQRTMANDARRKAASHTAATSSGNTAPNAFESH